MRLLLLSLIAFGAACATRSDHELLETPRQHLDLTGPATLTLYVSNQSFELAAVDIAIHLDGQLAVTGDFLVEGQHTWIPFDFAIAPGAHSIAIVSEDGAASLDRTFTMDDRKYGVVAFWYDDVVDDDGPREFSFDVMDEPPGFQ